MGINRLWQQHRNRKNKTDWTNEFEPTDRELQVVGLALPPNPHHPEDPWWINKWVEWIKEDRNKKERDRAIKDGLVNEDCEPLFDY